MIDTKPPIRTRLRFGAVAAMVAALALALAGCGGSSGGNEGLDGETVTLSFVGFTTNQSGSTDVPNWWMDEIEERTNGEVAFERYHFGTLCGAADIVNCVMDGRADVGVGVPAYTPNFFPIADMVSIPFATDSNGAVIEAFSRLYEENEAYQQEYEKLGLQLLAQWPSDRLIFGSGEEINGPDDINGKSFRVIGDGLTVAFESAGANVVSVTAAEMYEAVQRGVIDAWTNNFEGGPDFNLQEVSNHWRDPGVGAYTTLQMWFSDDAWSRLSPENQKVISEVSLELRKGEALALWESSLEDNCELLEGQIESFDRWTDAEIERWKKLVGDKAENAWTDAATAAGVSDPAAVLAEYRSYVEAYDDSGDVESSVSACIARFN